MSAVSDENMMDDDELVVLSDSNADDVFSEYEGSMILPEVGDKPRCKVLLISAPINRINAFQRASKSGNEKKTFAALCELIAESVVGPNGNAVWNRATIQKMAKSCTKRFVELQLGVLKHNGLTKEKAELEELIEDEGKN